MSAQLATTECSEEATRTADPFSDCPGPTLVVVGASNLHLGAMSLAAALDRSLGPTRPLLLMAPGAGRSYAKPAGFLGIMFPGHLETGICELVAERPPDRPKVALLMDIGNDLGYGETAERLLRWVDELKEGLLEIGFHVLIQRPPLASVAALSAGRFRVIKRLYFPDTTLGRDELLARVERLDEGLLTLIHERCELLPSHSRFAGPDGIHVAPWRLPEFWNGIASELATRAGGDPEQATVGGRVGTLVRGLSSRRLRPRRWARFQRWHDNPRYSRILKHGTTLVRL